MVAPIRVGGKKADGLVESQDRDRGGDGYPGNGGCELAATGRSEESRRNDRARHPDPQDDGHGYQAVLGSSRKCSGDDTHEPGHGDGCANSGRRASKCGFTFRLQAVRAMDPTVVGNPEGGPCCRSCMTSCRNPGYQRVTHFAIYFALTACW